MQGAPEANALLGLGAVFTLLFVTLGPLKIVGPFVQLTRDADEATMKAIAVRAFALAVVAVVAGGFLGQALLENWNISIPALLLAGGVIFLLVGLSLVLEQYQPVHPAPPPLPAAPMAAAMRITFPTVVTPYGIAALIVFLANSHDAGAYREYPRDPDRGDGAEPARDALRAPDDGRSHRNGAAGAGRGAGRAAGRPRG